MEDKVEKLDKVEFNEYLLTAQKKKRYAGEVSEDILAWAKYYSGYADNCFAKSDFKYEEYMKGSNFVTKKVTVDIGYRNTDKGMCAYPSLDLFNESNKYSDIIRNVRIPVKYLDNFNRIDLECGGSRFDAIYPMVVKTLWNLMSNEEQVEVIDGEEYIKLPIDLLMKGLIKLKYHKMD